MPERARGLPVETTQNLSFALPCLVARGVIYLRDPAILLGALPSVERVIARRNGTFRLILAPIHIPGHAIRPAGEIAIAAGADTVTIQSVPEEVHGLQPDEIALSVAGALHLTPASTGCTVRATLRLAATVPLRVIPSFMPRRIAQRTAETMLTLRLKQEMHAMAQSLARGYPTWAAVHPDPSPSGMEEATE